MKYINFQNIFKKKTNPINIGSSMAWPISFVRDWKIIVLIFACGLILLSLFSLKIYLSNQIGGGYLSDKELNSNTSIQIIDEKKLQTDILIFETRQADYLKLKAGHLKLIDPSL